ncbi:MAG: cell division FtsA domain-containing protein [Bacillota bacterium]
MEPVFALDIGTRTVIGIVGLREEDKFRVAAQEVVEHAGRAMYDGQIHDIPQVAVAVQKVKDSLEKKLGRKLERAAIAAAGRALATTRTTVEQKVNEHVEIDENTVRTLELIAVRKAQEQLGQEANLKDHYYYVGHSVVSYFLDGFPISNLRGHRAGMIAADVLATFLPASVVDSLFSVLARVGLQPLNLTLEPIAAVEVIIPEGLRLLNLALVDIGAGTSDIAVTSEGSVVAYGMVPLAGDEVSEAIVESCLVDFGTAEQIKRQLKHVREITYTDILGNQEAIASEELLKILDPTLNRLAEEIANTILNLNGGRSPKSVFCIGGSAQVPTLTDRIADKLAISPRRVGLKDRTALKNFVAPEGDPLAGPEGVTVIGIAAAALKNAGYAFIEIKINDREYKVFNFPGLRVSHALSHIDLTPRHLIARNGRDLKFFLNGREEVVRGELARPAAVLVNGKQASLQTPVQNGDEITFVPAQNGRDAKAFVKDYCTPELTLNITLNGKRLSLKPACYLNDLAVEAEAEIHDDDHLVIDSRCSLAKLTRLQGLNYAEILVNGKKVPPSYVLQEGDQVEVKADPFAHGGGAGAEEAGEEPAAGPAEHNGQILENRPEEQLKKNEKEIRVKINGEAVVFSGSPPPIFVDAFNYLEINPANCSGSLVLKLNGRPARYTDPLQDGDELEIIFKRTIE